MSQPQRPVKTFRAGRGMKIAIWRNEVESEGQVVVRYSCKLEKSYRDENDRWQTSEYLFVDELPRASKLLDTAFAWIILKEDNDDATDFSPPAE